MNRFYPVFLLLSFLCSNINVIESITVGPFSTLRDNINGSNGLKSTYDYIVVGGGAAGCAIARTLSESKYSVLLVERGGIRLEESEMTKNIAGMGRVVDDKKVSELIVTKQGVRTHTGRVLGGGTAINMGMIIEENPEFFDLLKTSSGATFNATLMNESYNWIMNRVSNKGDQNLPIVEPLESSFKDIGFVTQRNPDSDFSLKRVNGTWRVYNIFNVSDNGFRMSSDILLSDYQSVKENKIIERSPVDILINHTVKKIEFEKVTNQNERNIFNTEGNESSPLKNINFFEKSLLFRQSYKNTSNNDIPLNAKCVLLEKNSRLSHSEFEENPFFNVTTGTVMDNLDLDGVVKHPKNIIRSVLAKRVCVNEHGMIILSAGAIHTPILLYKSGIGPTKTLENMNIMPLLNVPNLGTNIVDRMLFAVPFFFKNNVITQPFVNPIMSSFSSSSDDCGYSCRTINIESLGGGRVVEGTLYATRLIFPPGLRNNIVTDFVIEIFKKCAENLPFSRNLPICFILEYPLECLRRSAAIFYFTPEPKSRGSLSVKRNGKFELDGNYLYDKEDKENVVIGMKSVINIIRSGNFETIAEEGGHSSCPMKVLNGIIGILASARTEGLFINKPLSPEFMNELENVYNEIISYKNTLFPEECSELNDPVPCLERKNIIFEKIATFPPILPDISDEGQILNLAHNIGTSIWHWSGSAPLGEIVENETFILSGTKNLGVVDASLLKILPRVNPVFTIMSVGRYAGISILKKREEKGGRKERIYG
ncbi:GMC oxidoreductase [Cryptosporidium felis]|nr:GMC oxidoreductase [Cryptosporidium felis]